MSLRRLFCLQVFVFLFPFTGLAQSIYIDDINLMGPDGTLLAAKCLVVPPQNNDACQAQIVQETNPPEKARSIQIETERMIKKNMMMESKTVRDTMFLREERKRAIRSDQPKKAQKYKKKLRSLQQRRTKLRRRARQLRSILRSLKGCKKGSRNACKLGVMPVKCAPEGCYGSDFGADYLNNTGNGDATLDKAIYRVGEIITANAFAYDSKNYGVTSWPNNIGEQLVSCGPESTTCSWRATAPTIGWNVAEFGISGYFGIGSEEVPFAIIK